MFHTEGTVFRKDSTESGTIRIIGSRQEFEMFCRGLTSYFATDRTLDVCSPEFS